MKELKTSHRIDYIDLMKGVCITLVVIVHCDVSIPFELFNKMLQNLRMPLYFFLSGLFFKKYDSFFVFFQKKINKNIIPYIFFALFPYSLFDLNFNLQAQKTWIYYFFMLIEPYNFPLWFLRSLFISYLVFWLIDHIHGIFAGVIVLLLSYISWKFSFVIPKGNWSFLLENFFTSLFALPFLYAAINIRKMGILEISFKKKHLLAIFIIAFIVWMICVQDNVYFYKAHLGNTWPLLYFSAFGGIACLWVICFQVKRLFYFSYMGRYSIVVLGTFCPLTRFLSISCGITGILQAVITLVIMPAMIYLCIHLFPWFTAQRDLIRIHV